MEGSSDDDGYCLMYPKDAAQLLIRYKEEREERDDGDRGGDPDPNASFSNVFFEFANAKRVGYKAVGNEDSLIFDQDESACGQVSIERA